MDFGTVVVKLLVEVLDGSGPEIGSSGSFEWFFPRVQESADGSSSVGAEGLGQLSLWYEKVVDLLSAFGAKALGAIFILGLGFWIVRRLHEPLRRLLERGKLDSTVAQFLSSLISYALLAFVIVAALGNLGVQTGSFVAVLGAAGLAIGLAMEGSLSNFAAGVLIAIFRPFRIGDYIEAADSEGQVENITIFYTTLCTLDNETIILPNSEVSSGKVVNYSAKEFVRIEVPFMIGNGADFGRAREVVLEVPAACGRVLDHPPAEVQVTGLAEAGVRMQLEVSVEPKDREDAFFEVAEEIKLRFDRAGIEGPGKRLDIRMPESALRDS